MEFEGGIADRSKQIEHNLTKEEVLVLAKQTIEEHSGHYKNRSTSRDALNQIIGLGVPADIRNQIVKIHLQFDDVHGAEQILNEEVHPELVEQIINACLSKGDIENAAKYAQLRKSGRLTPEEIEMRVERAIENGDVDKAIAASNFRQRLEEAA